VRTVLLCVLPIVVLAVGTQWRLSVRRHIEQFDQTLLDKAGTLATLLTANGTSLELEFADEFMPEYSRVLRPFFFQIFDEEERSVERSVSLRGEDLPVKFGEISSPRSFGTSLGDGRELRCVGVRFPVRYGNSPEQERDLRATVIVGAESAEVGPILWQAAWLFVLVALGALAGTWVAVRLAIRSGTRLLSDLAGRVAHFQRTGERQDLDPENLPVEIAPFAESLDESFRVLESVYERECRFNAHVAHELRTPITELRSAAEVALRWPKSDAAESLGADVTSIATHMSGLVESLLQLSSLEAATGGEAGELFRLDQLLELCVDDVRQRDLEGREVRVQEAAIEVTSSRELWTIILRNLIGNAVYHSPPGSRTDICLEADENGPRLSIENPAPALTLEDVERCTERLWKKEPQVTPATRFGLGLSIVEAACARLNLRLTLSLRGTIFCAQICCQEPPSH